MFVPIRVVTEVPAMVALEHDDGIFGESEPLELIEDLADLRVGIAHTRIIAADEIESRGIGDGPFLGMP